jgi:hypothetical protein
VGTLTVGVDAGNGLVVDEANREMVDGLRQAGRRVVELRRLAVRDAVGTKAVLAHLFRAAYLVGREVHDATDVLIEVNPRHASFYRRIFGFVRMGDEWICARVNAPAVLLRLDIANLDRKLTGFGALMARTGSRLATLWILSTLPCSSPLVLAPASDPRSHSRRAHQRVTWTLRVAARY